jgi:hypothetical protein
MRSEADEIATPLDPIYSGVNHNADYINLTRHRRNVLKYNHDTAKILDHCWKCPKFGIASAGEDGRASTSCRKCRATLLKALELQEQMKNKK